MKSKLISLAVASLILMTLISPLPISAVPHQSEPQNPPPGTGAAMWIEPRTINFDTSTISVGYKFNVTVFIRTNRSATAWQFQLYYDNNYFNAIRCGYAGDPSYVGASGQSKFFEGLSTIGVEPAFTPGGVLHGESLLTGTRDPEPNGAALSWIEFEVIAVPGKGETVNFELDIATAYPDDTYYIGINPDTQEEEKSPMEVYNTPVTFTWSPPPIPTLAIVPPDRFYDRYTEWVGTTFTEDVMFDDLDAAWFVTNVSCTVTFDPSFLEVVSVTFDPVWDVATSYTIDNDNGYVDLFAETSQSISGDVVIATLEFNITEQGTYPDIYESDLDFAAYTVFDHTLNITDVYGTNVAPAHVTVEGFLAVHMPHLEVVPNEVVFGPEPVVGKEFTVSVDIKRLHFAWKLIGVEFRMTYCDDMLEVVKVEEGDFFQPFAPYGTFFSSYVEPDYYGPHILVGTLILPNATGYWDQFPPYPGAEWGEPGENGTIATITFRITKQLTAWPPENLTCIFGLFDILLLDVDGNPVPFEPPVNGTYTCISNPARGAYIDVYGGAVNRDYGKIPFPAPYGGQGTNATMDMVAAQSEVTLFANVTYNYWPEQFKTVTFEIIDPYGTTWAKLTALTNENGVATVTFRMPWTCENATYYFGEWTVIASVEVADVKVFDYLWFKYDYLVNIWKVVTDKYYYEHYETVNVTVTYGTYAEEAIYPGWVTVTILDETGVPIGYAEQNVTIGGATYCSYYNVTISLTVYIPKWARAGFAYVHVSILDADPSEGGTAWCPEYVHEIYILPEP